MAMIGHLFNWLSVICLGIIFAFLSSNEGNGAQYPPNIERDPEIHTRLERIYGDMPEDYVARTRYLDGGQPRYVNRLIEEPSPYLRQHAHNPVDWHAWSKATLAKARRLDKPIFLSVGYATCHWCHVMEEESFDDEAVAALLNKHFIAIKIDREQQPDLDHLYLTATQIQQGQGGWPNSLWLTPDGRPFHTATYVAKGRFMELTKTLGDAWAEPQARNEIENVATNLAGAVKRFTQIENSQTVPLADTTFAGAAGQLSELHNVLEGGFSESVQFPQEGFILFLLDHWRREGDGKALEIALSTLDAIAAGGIHDHVGGGFHRYTVDPNWRTPHFEKMLYNQARLTQALLEAWAIAPKLAYRRAVERTFAYLERDMKDPEGAFYAAEDADSTNMAGESAEGAFYVFTAMDVNDLNLGEAVGQLGLDQQATLESGAVVHLDPYATPDFDAIDTALAKLRKIRERRPRPLRDNKIIAGWNGLAIRSLAEAAMALEEPKYARRAERAATAIWQRLWRRNGAGDAYLARLWVNATVKEAGTLDDYAWLGLGLVALFDATGDAVWLTRSIELANAIERNFADGSGRLRLSAEDGPLGPIYDNDDGSVPSGESSALEFLARLSKRTHDIAIDAQARRLKNALSGDMATNPLARPDALVAVRILERGVSQSWRNLSNGAVQAVFRGNRIDLKIAPGWHINAHEPGAEWLVGARIDGADAIWPRGVAFDASFADHSIQVYEGRLVVRIENASKPTIDFTFQTCSSEICLAPETTHFRRMPTSN